MRTRAPLFLLCISLFTASSEAQTVWHVDDDGDAKNGCTSWADACPELQTALGFAQSGDQIWVAAGTYRPAGPGGDRGATFQLLDGVGVYGGFDGTEATLEERAGLFDQTILSGDLNHDDNPVDFPGGPTFLDNSYHIVVSPSFSSTAVLDGFHLTAGNADGSSSNDENRGGGMLNVAASNPTVANCLFTRNTADFGGAMYNSNGDPVVTECVFRDNSALQGGGVYNFSGSTPTFTNCSFVDNSAVGLGGAMFSLFRSSSATLKDCMFVGNSAGTSGGAMYNAGGASPTLSNCTFLSNTANNDGGGMQNNPGDPTLTNCMFLGNTALNGGGMRNFSGSDPTLVNCVFSGNVATNRGGGMENVNNNGNPTLINCTFAGNSAVTFGGGMIISNDNPTVTNCILWGNEDSGGMDESAQIHDDGGGTPTVTFTLIQGLDSFGGATGNIDGDPLFVNADGEDGTVGTEDDDLRLSPGSPAIDDADNNAIPADTEDLDDDEDTKEPIPIDLGGVIRFLDDPSTADCPQPGADCGTAPIVDMGAHEFFADCNGNGMRDECDIDCGEPGGPCDLPACGQSGDCNENDIPDECDIFECPAEEPSCQDCDGDGVPDACQLPAATCADEGGTCTIDCDPDCNNNCVVDTCDISNCATDSPDFPACDDCNLNAIPDGCDINSGESEDIDPEDGVPDECIEWDGESKENDLWSTAENWENDVVPGVDDPAILESVVIAGAGAMVVLDVNADIDGLLLGSDVTMQGTDGDLLVRDPTGVLKGNMLVKGDLQAGDGHSISAEGEVIIGPGGVYHSPPNFNGPISAVLEAGSITVQGGSLEEGGGGSILLTDGMRLTSNGDLQLEESEDDGKGGCKGSDTPPDFNSMDNAEVVVSGSFVTGKCARVRVNSSEALQLGGDFDNSSVNPDTNTGFDWDAGALQMNGSSQTIEAAGEDRGPCPAGVNENFVIGTLTLAENAVVQVVDEIDNQRDGATACDEALYVGMLILEVGSELWTNGCRVYYEELMNDGLIPGLGTDVLQVESGCADMDGDGEVDAFDLASLLGRWGPCLPEDDCPADLSGDGVVDAFDLALLLGSWGPVS